MQISINSVERLNSPVYSAPPCMSLVSCHYSAECNNKEVLFENIARTFSNIVTTARCSLFSGVSWLWSNSLLCCCCWWWCCISNRCRQHRLASSRHGDGRWWCWWCWRYRSQCCCYSRITKTSHKTYKPNYLFSIQSRKTNVTSSKNSL